MKVVKNEELFIFNRMADGDKAAFRFFFDKYYTELCNLVNLYIHDLDKSEEIVQDIYVYFWEKKGDIKLGISVSAYLYKSAKNKSLNYLRDEKRKLSIREKLAYSSTGEVDSMVENELDFNQLRQIIKNAVDKLPPKCREVFVLAKEKDFSYKEIACQMGISEKTVENQMGKALKKLRELLRPYYGEIFTLLLFSVLFLSTNCPSRINCSDNRRNAETTQPVGIFNI